MSREACGIQAISWCQLFVPRKDLAHSMSLPFEGHTEQKECLLYVTRKVKKMAGYAVKLPKYCCIDNRFCKVRSKMTKQFEVTVLG